jgi:hypothetical protein
VVSGHEAKGGWLHNNPPFEGHHFELVVFFICSAHTELLWIVCEVHLLWSHQIMVDATWVAS